MRSENNIFVGNLKANTTEDLRIGGG